MGVREVVEERVSDLGLRNVMVGWRWVSFARGGEWWSSTDVELPRLVRRRTKSMAEASW